MAQVKVSDLPTASGLSTSDTVITNRSGVTSKTTAGAFTDTMTGFTPAGSSPTARTVQAKERDDWVDLADYLPAGYVTDGSVDYATQITNALSDASGQGLRFPPGGGTFQSSAAQTLAANTALDLRGGTLKFSVTGATKCLDLRSGTRVINGTVENAGTSPSGSGDYQCPIIIGSYGAGTGYSNIELDGLTIKTNRAEGNGIMVTGTSHNVTISNITFPDSAYLMIGVLLHWGGANDPTTRTYHPHDIKISNLKFGVMSYASASDAGQVLVSGCYNVAINGVEIEDAHNAGIYLFCGDYGFNYAAADIVPFANRGITVDNVAIRSTDKYGVYIRGDASGTVTQYEIPATLTNVVTRGNDTDDGHGFYFHKSGGSKLVECEASNHHNGVYVRAISGVFSNNVKIIGGKFYDNDTVAGTSYGVMLEDGTSGHEVRGCRCHGNRNAGIYSDADNPILDSNILGVASDPQLYGIRLGPNGTLATVTNNYCREAATAAYSSGAANLRLYQNNTAHADVSTVYDGSWTDSNVTGTWTPTANSLTVVGTPTYTGNYHKIGRIVFWTLRVQSTTSTASTAGSTNFTGLPYTPARPVTCGAANTSSVASYGVGLVDLTPAVYTPTWGAVADVTVSGIFETAT